MVGTGSLPRRRFRGLTARSHRRKGHGQRAGRRCGRGGPCPGTIDLSEATPRRRGRDPEGGPERGTRSDRGDRSRSRRTRCAGATRAGRSGHDAIVVRPCQPSTNGVSGVRQCGCRGPAAIDTSADMATAPAVAQQRQRRSMHSLCGFGAATGSDARQVPSRPGALERARERGGSCSALVQQVLPRRRRRGRSGTATCPELSSSHGAELRPHAMAAELRADTSDTDEDRRIRPRGADRGLADGPVLSTAAPSGYFSSTSAAGSHSGSSAGVRR